MDIATLLDKARQTCSIPSDNALAQRLGKTRQAVSNYRARGLWPENDTIAQLARMAGEDAGPWLVEAEMTRARSESERRAWKKIAERLSHAAAIALVALLFNSPAQSNDRSIVSQQLSETRQNDAGLYIMRNQTGAVAGSTCWIGCQRTATRQGMAWPRRFS
ncbi:MAG: hypothetical protein KDI75_07385 [Xanthomonadales bacterium]|nr:hypothetical protein [Xanthomonadales bacterium]